ncbi:MAG: helix-turn-helix domain-containing protein [Gemmataceae bacterium]
MKLKKALSIRIKKLREASGLSQQDLAGRGDLSLSLVAKLEQGKKADPRASTLLALAKALNVRPGELLDDLFSPEEGQGPTPAPAPAHVPSHSNGKVKDIKSKKKPIKTPLPEPKKRKKKKD